MVRAGLPASSRVASVDALRGFAVLCILLLHNVEHFIFSVYPTDSPKWLSWLDGAVTDVAFGLFGGKAYAVFALLFGFSFFVQHERVRREGGDFGWRFLWRLLLLCGFASLNALLFPGGDVLLLYALLGVSLFVVRGWSDRAVLWGAVLCFAQPLEWVRLVAGLCGADWPLSDYGVGAMYGVLDGMTRHGSFWEFLWCNVTTGQVASLLWALGAGRVEQTVGLFLLGLWIGRKGLFADGDASAAFWSRVLPLCAVSYAALGCVNGLFAAESELVRGTVGVAFDMWQKLSFTLVLVSGFLLLWRWDAVRRCVDGLRVYGRMSLTNYVSQSLLGFLVYFPFALYLAPHLGASVSVLVGMAMFAAQLWFCRWWLSRHAQGPLEGLWRKLTWL